MFVRFTILEGFPYHERLSLALHNKNSNFLMVYCFSDTPRNTTKGLERENISTDINIHGRAFALPYCNVLTNYNNLSNELLSF